MGSLLVALGIVGGLVGLAWNKADDPTVKTYLQKRRLLLIAGKPVHRVSTLEAEDGLFLAKKFGEKTLQLRFEKLVASRRKKHT